MNRFKPRSNPVTGIEQLEVRRLMSADVESLDGTGNSLLHSDWGSVDVQLLRAAAAAYADGVSSPTGATRPSAREISNTVSELDGDLLNNRHLSAFVYAWGQFLDHDLDLTTTTNEAFNVAVPAGDSSFDPNNTGTVQIGLNRSTYDTTTGTSTSNPRQQINTITAWIDGSAVYGSDSTRAASLRTFVGGMLKSSAGNLLPLNADGLPNANDAHIFADNQLFLAGDVRANENIELTAIQTMFMREHNRLAAQIARQQRGLTDEQIYQAARKMVIAEIQSITYNEFIPALLGRNALTQYRGYNARVNPGISNEFSAAAFRFGHSMVGNDVEFLDDTGGDVRDDLSFAEAFFNPEVVKQTGIDPIIKYLSSDLSQEVDIKVVDPLRNFLFGPPGSSGLDLVSLNIQRGRDHGLADYNSVRAAYGLPKVTGFSQITSDPVLQQQLQTLYGSVDNIDLWVGGLAENHVAGSSLGPTFRRILADQFQRLRDGDRFWFERQFSGLQLFQLEHTTLSDVIKRNTTLRNVQDDVFTFSVTIAGQLFTDRNTNGRQDRMENGLSGWTVQLLDADGVVIDDTLTSASGSYNFADLSLGTYRVRTVAPTGWTQTSRDPADIQITHSDAINGVNFGFFQGRMRTPIPTTAIAATPPSAMPDADAPPVADVLALPDGTATDSLADWDSQWGMPA